MAGPDPEHRLHANRPFSVPWTSDRSRNVFSRGDILLGKQKAAFGSGQSLGVAASGEDPHILATHPQKWPNSGKVLKVPKCVILSSLPYWTVYWPSCYFYGPRDIIGQMFTPPNLFGNYYYFDQWNNIDPSQEVHDNTIYCNDELGLDCGDLPSNSTIDASSPFWDNFHPPVPEDEKILYTRSYNNQQAGLPPSSTDGIAETNIPPETRYNQIIANIRTNPYYTLHPQIMAAFRQAKLILESDPVDPIYVTIPEWMPDKIVQTRNGTLTKPEMKFNTSHGTGCDIIDVIPCYGTYNVAWGPPYPDPDDSRNRLDFPACNVPYLASTDPGFGTNTLHLYVGHGCHRYSSGDTIFDYQAWPLQPEGQWIGPIFNGSYLGAGLPFFQGRRSVWRDAGFDYGFVNHGAAGIYNNYSGLIGGAADAYKQNFYKHRQFATRLFTYPSAWNIEWKLDEIWNDQRHDCHSTQFYFGFSFDEFQSEFSNEDNWYSDCSGSPGAGPTHIKFAEHIGNEPDSASIRTAISTFYPPIKARVESYFNGIEAGTADFFKLVIKNQGLADYNVQYGGSFAPLLDADAIVAYVREYFAKNP
jgi:hypothetical protein